MRTLYPILFTCLLILLFPVNGQTQWMQTNGPCGGAIKCYASTDTNIYVGTWGSGVFRSINKGISWIPANYGIHNKYVNSMATSDSNIFIGTYVNGFFRSTNYGENWTKINPDWYPGHDFTWVINFLVINDTDLFAGINGGLFRSTDDGTSWRETGLTDVSPNNLIIRGTNLFVGTWGQGFYRSTDYGTSWIALNSGLTDNYIYSLAMVDTILFAGTIDAGVYRSTNKGENWSPVNEGLTGTCITELTTNNINLLATISSNDIFISTNFGENWTVINSGLGDLHITSLYIYDAGIYAGTWNGGVFRSDDTGASWVAINNGLTGTYVYALTTINTTIIAGTANGNVYRSTENDSVWTATGLVWGYDAHVLCLSNKDDMLFAGTGGSMAGGGVFRSSDIGITWNSVGPFLCASYPSVWTVAVSETILYAGTGNDGVFLSTNDGTSWDRIDSGYFTYRTIKTLIANGKNIYVGTDDGIYRSTDGGISWTEENSGITNTQIKALAIIGSNIFAGTVGGGIFRSTDNGSSWVSINSGLNNDTVHTIIVIGGNLFAGTSDGIYHSSDNGSNWEDVGSRLTNRFIRALTFNETYLYAGGWSGVWKRPLAQIVTSVLPSVGQIPNKFSLKQNFPNPFNPITSIGYELPRTSHVTLKVFDVLGREVVTLVDGVEELGYKIVNFNAKGLASGLYYYRLQTDYFSETKKLLLLR